SRTGSPHPPRRTDADRSPDRLDLLRRPRAAVARPPWCPRPRQIIVRGATIPVARGDGPSPPFTRGSGSLTNGCFMRAPAVRRPANHFHPCFDRLEDRSVPAVITVTSTDDSIAL